MKNLAIMAGFNTIQCQLVIVAYFFGPPCICLAKVPPHPKCRPGRLPLARLCPRLGIATIALSVSRTQMLFVGFGWDVHFRNSDRWCVDAIHGRAGDLCLSPRVSVESSVPTRLTTFTTWLGAADTSGRLPQDVSYHRLSSSGSDACLSTPSHPGCVVVDQSSHPSTCCHEPHDCSVTGAGHYERFQRSTTVVQTSSFRKKRKRSSHASVINGKI